MLCTRSKVYNYVVVGVHSVGVLVSLEKAARLFRILFEYTSVKRTETFVHVCEVSCVAFGCRCSFGLISV